MKKVFIDGSVGTTGLEIRSRLEKRRDIELVALPEERRKDPAARKEALDSCDVAFLCLPDDAAREAVSLVENPAVTIIDASTAHRVSEGWEYGFPELAGRRERIASSRRIANPGCHASGYIALVEPLVRAGLLKKGAAPSAFSLTGYTGGGKKMIAAYEEALSAGTQEYLGGRQYALGQMHKHLPEIAAVCSLPRMPVFSPVIVPHARGMETTVFLSENETSASVDEIRQVYRETYREGNGVVRFAEDLPGSGVVSSAAFALRDGMAVSAFGTDGRIVLVSLFDNLGKGASGAAIQNMNIALGFPETEGLVL